MNIEELRKAAETLMPALPLKTAKYNAEMIKYPTNYPLAACYGEGALGVTGEHMGAALVLAANALPALLAECDRLKADCRSFRSALEAHEEVKATLAAENAALREAIADALEHAEYVDERLRQSSVRSGDVQCSKPEAAECVATLRAALAAAKPEGAEGSDHA